MIAPAIPADDALIYRVVEAARRADASTANVRFLVREITGVRPNGDTIETMTGALSYGHAVKLESALRARRKHG